MDNPLEAMFSSLLAFIVGAAFPLVAGIPFSDFNVRTVAVLLSSCVGLLIMGAIGGKLGGANPFVGAARVFAGGLLAMGITFGLGKAFGVVLD